MSRAETCRVRTALLLWLACLPGCLPSEQVPDVSPPPAPASCDNGLCEPSLGESDLNCLSDCPHCWAVFATRSSDGAVLDLVTGKQDGKTASITENEAIDLTFGRELQLDATDQTTPDNAAPSVQLYGTVTGSAQPPSTSCGVTADGAVLVQASIDGRTGFQTLGVWTQGGSTEFSLACARQITSTRFLRLTALAGASLTLDAAQAVFSAEIEQSACEE